MRAPTATPLSLKSASPEQAQIARALCYCQPGDSHAVPSELLVGRTHTFRHIFYDKQRQLTTDNPW